MTKTQKQLSIVSIAFFTTLLLALFFIGCSSTPSEVNWLYDYEEAQEIAEKDNKNILLFFTGSDWDEISQALFTNVFPSKGFLSKVASQYVLVQLDFPEDENLIDEEQYYKNYDVANKLSIEGIPSVILTTKEGYVIDSYDRVDSAEKASDYIKQIQKSKTKANKIASTLKKVDAATGPKKAKLIDTLLGQLSQEHSYLHTDLIAQIPELDPENTTKLQTKYLLQLAYPKSMDALYSGDFDTAINLLLEVAENDAISKSDSQEAYYTAAYINSQVGYSDEVTISYLQSAHDVDPSTEVAENIRELIAMIYESMQQQASMFDDFMFDYDDYPYEDDEY